MKKKSRAEMMGVPEPAYKKYLEKYDKLAPANIKKSKMEKAARRKEWWQKNWIAFVSMVFSAIAIIISLLR